MHDLSRAQGLGYGEKVLVVWTEWAAGWRHSGEAESDVLPHWARWSKGAWASKLGQPRPGLGGGGRVSVNP